LANTAVTNKTCMAFRAICKFTDLKVQARMVYRPKLYAILAWTDQSGQYTETIDTELYDLGQ